MTPNKGGTVDVNGVKVTLTDAQHSSSTDDGTYAGESCGLVVEVEDGFTLYFAGDTNVFGDMPLIARIYEPDSPCCRSGTTTRWGRAKRPSRSSCLA